MTVEIEQYDELRREVSGLRRELERVTAHRDELEDWSRHYKARADTALSALREIAAGRSMRTHEDVAAQALAELEGEA